MPPRASGDGMATAGIIMGWIQVGLAVVSICCVAIYFIVIVGWVGRGIPVLIPIHPLPS